MLEMLKFGIQSVPTIQVQDSVYVAVKDIKIALGVDQTTIQAIVRNHLPADLKFNKTRNQFRSEYNSKFFFVHIYSDPDRLAQNYYK